MNKFYSGYLYEFKISKLIEIHKKNDTCKINLSFVFYLILSSIVLFSCDLLSPPENNNDKPDSTSHNYIWKADTIWYWPETLQILPNGVWGSSEDNVIFVGHSDDVDYQIFKYNGNEWINITPRISLYNGYGRYTPQAIHGFDSTDIWVAGYRYYRDNYLALVLRFDGTEWEDFTIDTTTKRDSKLYYIWGESSDDIYAVGQSGIYHYDGNKWEHEFTSPENIWFYRIIRHEEKLYTTAYTIYDQGIQQNYRYFFYEKVDSLWEIVEEYKPPHRTFGQCLFSTGDRLFSVGHNIYEYIQDSWSISEPAPEGGSYWNIWGNSPINIFAVGYPGIVSHYNGKSWHFYTDLKEKYSAFSFNDIWCTDKKVFIIGRDGFRALILRGTLQEGEKNE